MTANTQTTDVQHDVEQFQDKNLAIDFSHRLAFTDHLDDSLGLMTDRLLGILHLLSAQFEGESGRLSDDLIYCAIDAAINEVTDIRNLSRAHVQAEHAKRQAESQA